MTSTTFELVRTATVPSLSVEVEEYAHPATGARHFHLSTKDTNNAFIVAFRTIPQDSTGVAHILEHTTLCGSRHFPVRDPFFMMIRRSLNTFMNAFTSNDWTAYPFASQNRKDFDNLLQVYLDAVFFPNLDPLDFAQEGHRVEFARPEDPTSDLEYRGVVYNEMKGAMSSPIRQLWQNLQSALFPTTTYHFNSGGEPRQIPNLTYAQLKEFHARHYHPSNAVFMTYGNFPVAEHQERIEALALGEFTRQALDVDIPLERRYPKPVSVETRYALDPSEEQTEKTHIVMGWLLGESANLREAMYAHLLSDVLLDNSASPLRKALETTDLGTAPSELCGMDDDLKEMVFACGLEGAEPDRKEAVEQLILNVLEDVAEHGVPLAQLEAVLHQLELNQREIGGGRFPYGLQLMVKALPAVLHGADPVAVLDIDPVLEHLREQIQDPEFIKTLTRALLLSNSHRVTLTMSPDKGLSAEEQKQERERLMQLQASMTEIERQQVIALSEALRARQERVDDPEVLPKVGIADVPNTLKLPEGSLGTLSGTPVTWFDQPTNGLVYEQIVTDLPRLDESLVDVLPLFCECLTEVGCNGRDYLQTQAWQAAVSGGISARSSLRASIDDVQQVKGSFVLATKSLARNQRSIAELLRDTFSQARFDELARLRELVAQIRGYREAHVTSQGHALAMTAASAGMNPVGALAERWSGLQSISKLKQLDDLINNETELKDLAERFQRIQSAILASSRQFLIVAEADQQPSVHETIKQRWNGATTPVSGTEHYTPSTIQQVVRTAWSTNTQVNFSAKAYPTVALEHPDAPALMVLGPLLRNGFLHTNVREKGGAYGAGAGYNSDTGAFRFFSYRDPRLKETLDDFDRALDWLLSERHEFRILEEAILNLISDIDRPDSPAGEAIGTFFSALHGRTPEQRRRCRQKILEVSLEDVQRVAQTYLRPENASVAVLSNLQTLEQSSELGLEIKQL